LVTLPEAPKLMLMVLAGERLPLPETVDCTTPLDAATIRSCADEAVVWGPTVIAAATTAPTAIVPRPRLSGVM
jgi:hypothetical protein